MISYLNLETQGKKGGLNSFFQPLETPAVAQGFRRHPKLWCDKTAGQADPLVLCPP